MSRNPESLLVAACQRRLKQRLPGSIVRKLSDNYTAGLPDLQAIFRSLETLMVIEIECKTDKGEESALQKHERNRCVDALDCEEGHYDRVVIRSVKELDELLDTLTITEEEHNGQAKEA